MVQVGRLASPDEVYAVYLDALLQLGIPIIPDGQPHRPRNRRYVWFVVDEERRRAPRERQLQGIRAALEALVAADAGTPPGSMRSIPPGSAVSVWTYLQAAETTAARGGREEEYVMVGMHVHSDLWPFDAPCVHTVVSEAGPCWCLAF